MRVAIVTKNLGFVGGVESFNRDIEKVLLEKGHEVDVFGLGSTEISFLDNLEKAVGEKFNQANKVKEYDKVICNGEFGYFVDHPNAINVFHGNYYGYALALRDLVDSNVTRQRLKKAEMQKESAKGKYVVTVSNSSRDQLEEFGISVDEVINNSVDTNTFYPMKEVSHKAHNLAISRGRYYEKGLDVLKRLGDKGMKIKLYSDTELPSENICNMGLIDNSQLGIEYNSANIFLSPSRFEGGSLTPLEAMACGCPILITPTGYGQDIKRVVNNFVAGNFDEYFVKAYLVSNEREKYSKIAFNYFMEFHNPENFKERWIELIEG